MLRAMRGGQEFAIVQPYHQADAEHSDDLRQQQDYEELPEQATHGLRCFSF